MKILVLGSEGIIGKALSQFLIEKGYQVTNWDILLDNSHDLRISAPNMDKYDFIYFLAFDIGGAKYLSMPSTDFIDNNLKIMLNVFNQLKCGVPFIFASSQMHIMNNPYGALKKLGEQYTNLLNGISVRFWNVYDIEKISIKSHVIPDFIHQWKTTGEIKIITTGTEKRQFLHANDCAEGLYVIMKNFQDFKSRKFIDLANFEWITIKDLAHIIADNNVIIGTKVDEVQFLSTDPDPFILNYWKPKISLKEGIIKYINHIYNNT